MKARQLQRPEASRQYAKKGETIVMLLTGVSYFEPTVYSSIILIGVLVPEKITFGGVLL